MFPKGKYLITSILFVLGMKKNLSIFTNNSKPLGKNFVLVMSRFLKKRYIYLHKKVVGKWPYR